MELPDRFLSISLENDTVRASSQLEIFRHWRSLLSFHVVAGRDQIRPGVRANRRPDRHRRCGDPGRRVSVHRRGRGARSAPGSDEVQHPIGRLWPKRARTGCASLGRPGSHGEDGL